MHSLYHSLLAQHPRQLTPVRCAESTIVQLHRYFEEVVLENNLAALVVESPQSARERSTREVARVKELARTAGNLFLFVTPHDALAKLMLNRGKESTQPVVFDRLDHDKVDERFVVIADARFSALLASVRERDFDDNSTGDMVVWTFEPDVVFSALEYLMARVTAEHPFYATSFSKAVKLSMPMTTSLQLTLGVTTKLARLLQEQAEREIAVNRIATAMRNSTDLDIILQTATNEVGRALNVTNCAVAIEGDLVQTPMTECYFRGDLLGDESVKAALLADLQAISATLSRAPETLVVDGDSAPGQRTFALAAVPLIDEGKYVGLVLIECDDPARVWVDNELLLLHTVADQLTVAVKKANLFAQIREQALTDALTGCFNRRSFEMQLERDLHLATRMRQPLSLIIMDLDNFKYINDRAGHGIGDVALRTVAEALRIELRGVDTAARFGGDEFVIILPQATAEGALVVAERLRQRVEDTEIPGYGRTTASFGLAAFPLHASSRDTLVVAADRALYNSKKNGRNCVSLPPEEELPIDDLPSNGASETPRESIEVV